MRLSVTIKTFFLLLIFVLPVSCGQDEQTSSIIPDTILSEEKLTEILIDFALAESASNINVKNVPSERADSTYAFDPLIENKVTKAQYDSTIVFYSKHPGLYKKIYENVLVALSKMQVKKDSTKVDLISK